MTFGKLAVLSLIGALGAVAFSAGCGSEVSGRYYCDTTGCFDCDGFGCNPVPTPSKPNCRSTTECGPDAACTSVGCAQKCTTDDSCPRGEVCRSGLCVAPTTTTPPTTKECTDRTDCGASATCVAGTCKACGGTNGPCPCTTQAQCAGSDVCVAGSCVPKASTCTFSSECAANQVCADGQCLAECDANRACGTGFTCDRGACRPVGSTTCSDTVPCAGGQLCVASSCVPTCTTDPQCGAGKYCNQGACVVDTRPQPNCTTDAQCAGGGNPRVCRDGYCKYTCTDDQGCRTIDSRIGYCAQDKVCRTAQEANPECRESAQCGAGKICIDNQCR